MHDLWSPKIETAQIKSPAVFLKEQASLLGQKTKNIVIAEVEQLTPISDSTQFVYRFHLVAPTMRNYHYRLFTVFHYIDLYPVTFELERDLESEIRIAIGKTSEPLEPIVANNEGEFLVYLGLILGANKTTDVVNSLIAIATSFEGDRPDLDFLSYTQSHPST